MSVKPDINVYRVKDTLTGRERVVHRNLLLSVSFLPCEREEELGSVHPESGSAAHSDLCPDVPDVLEDSDVRTANWLMQADDEVHLEDGDSLDQASDVSRSDSLSVDTSSQASLQAPDHDVAPSPVVDVGDPLPPSRDVLPLDMDMSPPGSVCPDFSPSDVGPTDMTIPVDSSPDIDLPHIDAPERAVVGSDRPDAIPDSLPQVAFAQPNSRVLRDRRSIRPPKRLVCEMNNQAVDEDSVSSVSVSSLIQFFSSALLG